MIIELGRVDEPVAPARRRLRPALGGAAHRAVAVVALVALVFAVAGPAAPPRPAGLIRVASIPFDDQHLYSADDETLYVPTRGAVSAYALADGRLRCTAAVPGDLSDPYYSAQPGVLISRTENSTAVFDPATGALLWQLPGTLRGSLDGVLVLVEDAGPDLDRMRVVEASTGTVLWTARPGPDAAVTLASSTAAAGADLLVVAAPDGAATVHRLPGGAAVGTGRIPRTAGADPGAELIAGYGALYLVESGPAGSTVAAYRLPGFEPLWRSALPGQELRPGQRPLQPCGALLCVDGPDGFTAIDPLTGTRRWAAPAGTHLAPVRAGALLPVVDGRLPSPRSALLDPATGRVVADLADNGFAFASPDVLIRADRADPDRTVVARPVAGGAVPVGVLDGVVREGCRGEGDYLACPLGGRFLAVWRIPRTG